MNSFKRNHPLFYRAIIYVSLITFTVGCTSMRAIPISNTHNIAVQLVVGDKVEVTRKNGDIVKFTVEQISESGISGQGHAIAFDDMQQLRVAQSTGSNGDKYGVWIILGLVVVLFATGVLEGQDQGF